MRCKFLQLLGAIACWAACAPALAVDALAEGFRAPPEVAKPRVYWNWMDGNVTEDGIRKDLEWMRKVGIGGVVNFEVALSMPRQLSSRLVYMTPAWQDAGRVAASTAARLGLELSVASSPGWSGAGGPGVVPEEAMKKLVWSETRIKGGKPFAGRLPQPPSTVGPFQNVPIDRTNLISGTAPSNPIGELYVDAAVIAYRIPDADVSMSDSKPRVTSSGGPIEGSLLWDGDLERTVAIPFGAQGEPAWVQYAFEAPLTIRALSLVLPNSSHAAGFFQASTVVAELQSSRDGTHFTKVTDILISPDVRQTLSFEPVTARYFRLVLPTPAAIRLPAELASALGVVVKNPTEHLLAEFVLHTAARVNRAEDKAGFFVATDLETSPTPPAPATAVVRHDDVIDLSSHLRADGVLEWTPPPGRWAVLRLGYSLLGITNHPASPEATGLEIDYLSREHVRAYYSRYLDLSSKRMPGLHGMENDSWEVGAQNWTEDLPAEFARRRGYDLHPWLPALTGVVIGSSAATDRFLWDFRRTLGEMLAENHYHVVADELHKRGMIHYVESHEFGRAFVGDGMDVKRFSDIPMGAMWADELRPQRAYDADIRESASVAHLYGQNLVGVEALSTHGFPGNTFAYAPEALKPVADRAMVDGANDFILHASVHQPTDEPGPGFTLGPYGQWFTRHETWAEEAGPWVTYLARSAYLLQQGRFVADVLYFYGEDSNITALYGRELPPIPAGYAFDFVNVHALDLLSVDDGQLATQSGMRYRVLVLDPRTRSMSLSALLRIRDLVNAGATVVGAKPLASPSLADDPAKFRDIADAVWGTDGLQGERRVGKGRVIDGLSAADALSNLGIEPDFNYVKPAADSQLLFVHRTLSEGGDIFFVDNRQPRAETVEASFRVSGKAPELWHADTGLIEAPSYRVEGGRTRVSLKLDASDAVFVVFRHPADEHNVIPEASSEVVATLEGPWSLGFAPGLGAPPHASFDKLQSWTDSSDLGVKYFSGTATYDRTVSIPRDWLKDHARLELDLGAVRNLAEVLVNGRSVGVLWKAPFKIDITDAVRVGRNRIAIRVTNLWPNRLIGDRQPGAGPMASTTYDPFKANSPLLESGLLGPVRVLKTSASGSR